MLKWKKKCIDPNTAWLEADTFYGKYCIESSDINLLELGSEFLLYLEQNHDSKKFNITFRSIDAAKKYANSQFDKKLKSFLKKHLDYAYKRDLLPVYYRK